MKNILFALILSVALVGCESEAKYTPTYGLGKCYFVPDSLKGKYAEISSKSTVTADLLYKRRDLCLCIHLSENVTVFVEEHNMTSQQKRIFRKLQQNIKLIGDTTKVELN